MGLVYTFYSPKEDWETISLVKNIVNALGGKIKSEKGHIIKASWRSKRFITVFPTKYTFYIGKDMVRVVTGSRSSGNGTMPITMQVTNKGVQAIWEEFILKLSEMYPSEEFCLKPGIATIDSIKLMSDGVEKVYTSSTWHTGTIGVGSLFYGGVSVGTASSDSKFSNKFLAQVRYTNGLTYEGELHKNSPAYHEIMANLSLYEK